jgi:glutathione S-transferase
MAVNLYPYIDFAFDGGRLTETEEQNAVVRRKGGQYSLGIFDILEKRLAEDGPFLLGDNFSAADIYLFMLTLWAYPSERAVLERYPHIAKIAAHVRARPRLKAALDAHGALTVRTAEAA